jgi:hypothetical protein
MRGGLIFRSPCLIQKPVSVIAKQLWWSNTGLQSITITVTHGSWQLSFEKRKVHTNVNRWTLSPPLADPALDGNSSRLKSKNHAGIFGFITTQKKSAPSQNLKSHIFGARVNLQLVNFAVSGSPCKTKPSSEDTCTTLTQWPLSHDMNFSHWVQAVSFAKLSQDSLRWLFWKLNIE